MADATAGSSPSADPPLPDNRLFDLYQKYLGDPDDETDVYLGFGLFFGGISAAALGFVLFLIGAMNGFGGTAHFTWTGPAYALGMLSVPSVMVGVVVLLPVEGRARRAAMGGGAIIVAAVAFFLYAYPWNFNSPSPPDYTVPVVALYGVGAAVVVGSTGAALVANFLEQAQGPSFEEVEAMRAEEEDDRESWSEAEIRADIEEAMENTDINWGGVEKTDHRDLNLNLDEVEIDASGMDVDPDTVRMEGVDDHVDGLKQLKGGDKKTTKAQDSTVDDQTAALNQLKQQKREGQTPAGTSPADDSEEGGVVDKVRGLFD